MLLVLAVAGAVGGTWALRNGNPTGWVQDLLPELIGFLLGSIATYVIIDRLIESGRRHTWRAVEGQLLYDEALYAARVLDALAIRYSDPGGKALLIGLEETRRGKDEPAGAIGVNDVVTMLRQAQRFGAFADAARLVLDTTSEEAKPSSHEYFTAVATLERLLKPRSDDRLPHLRHLLDVAPNLDLIVRIADEPTVARRALEAQSAITSLREHLFFGDDDPPTSSQMGNVCRALTAGTQNTEDLRLLRIFMFELGHAHSAGVALSLLTMAIGKHRSTWSRDRQWRQVRELR